MPGIPHGIGPPPLHPEFPPLITLVLKDKVCGSGGQVRLATPQEIATLLGDL